MILQETPDMMKSVNGRDVCSHVAVGPFVKTDRRCERKNSVFVLSNLPRISCNVLIGGLVRDPGGSLRILTDMQLPLGHPLLIYARTPPARSKKVLAFRSFSGFPSLR